MPSAPLGSQGVAADQRDNTPPSWSSHSGGEVYLNPQNGCAGHGQRKRLTAVNAQPVSGVAGVGAGSRDEK